MWACTGQNISMARGDFGIELPIVVSGATFGENDELRVKITRNGETVLAKAFGNIQQNTVNLVLTEAETGLLPVGAYRFSLDWYQDGVFMCNVIESAGFRVVAKE